METWLEFEWNEENESKYDGTHWQGSDKALCIFGDDFRGRFSGDESWKDSHSLVVDQLAFDRHQHMLLTIGVEAFRDVYEFRSWVLGFPFQTEPASYQGRRVQILWSIRTQGNLSKLRPTDFEQSTVTGRGVLTLHLVVTVSVIVSLLGLSLLVHLHRKPSTLSRLSNTVDPAHLGASVACSKCLWSDPKSCPGQFL